MPERRIKTPSRPLSFKLTHYPRLRYPFEVVCAYARSGRKDARFIEGVVYYDYVNSHQTAVGE